MAIITFPIPTQVKNILEPVANSDAVTKYYVDSHLSAVTFSPSGSNTQIQFNNSGTFGSSSKLTFDSSSNLFTVLGNISASNANLGNAVSANYFIGSGNNLSNIQGGNVSGAVNLATYATTANSVAGSNVSGQVANALIAGTVYTNSQPNITSVGTLSNLTVSGNISANNATVNALSISNVGNLNITGGNNGYVISTDGSGNLSWIPQPVSAITVDKFTGNGIQTTFTLSTAPDNVNEVLVNFNGTFQPRDVFTLSGANITFIQPPDNTSFVEVTTIKQYASNNVPRKASTAYNIVNQTVTSLDTISARVAANGVPQISALSGTISTCWTTLETVAGTIHTNNNISTSTAGIWTNINVNTALTNSGDCVVVNFQDETNQRFYRITYVQTTTSGNSSVVIESLI
jgi:hypothetical protein